MKKPTASSANWKFIIQWISFDAQIPLVTFHRFDGDRDIPTVAIDDYLATSAGVQHLREHGHRHIGFIGGRSDLPDVSERRRAWQDCLDLSEAEIDSMVSEGEFSRMGGYLAARELLTQTPRLSAVFVTSGTQAIGALRAFNEAGRKIPEDISVVAFDGTQETEFSSPPLTTIRPPLGVVATTALELLLDKTDQETGIHRVVPHELVLRESCGHKNGS